jgi:hypothetical protein
LAASEPSQLFRFVHFPQFLRDWERLKLDDAALQALEQELLGAPDKAPVIKGTGGLRKQRFTTWRPSRRRPRSYGRRVLGAHG